MQSNRQFWEEQGEAWKPAEKEKASKKKKTATSVEEGATEDEPLVVRKGNWRHHFVNGHGFTIGLATFAVCIISAVVLAAAMVVSGTAKEVQELAPAPKEYRSSTYGAKHSGVGFANYVVGNAVQSFWQKEMGKKGPAKLSDPFASFLLKKKGKKGAAASGSASDETPEQQADDAQPVDEEHGKIAGARATPEAIQHAKDVRLAHQGAASAGKRGRNAARSTSKSS